MSLVQPLIIVMILFLAYSSWIHYLATQERRDLYDRLMARSLPEYLAGSMPPSPSAIVGSPSQGHVADPDFPYEDEHA